MANLNPSYNPSKRPEPSVDELINGMRAGDTGALAQCITLIESEDQRQLSKGHEVLDALLPASKAVRRIGITGVPGVGKSTFIDVLGSRLVEQGSKVAVLAVDPSSKVSGGSILGDKTRMEELSAKQGVFVRPSPSAGALGGVANATHDTILLCEVFGFDVVLVETVGVGQSETEISEMVDLFLLLMLPGAGDELQGIKRGIMEMADMLVINKAEGDLITLADQAVAKYKSALHLMPPNLSNWEVPVLKCSALQGSGIDDVQVSMDTYFEHIRSNGFWDQLRKERAVTRFDGLLNQLIVRELSSNVAFADRKAEVRSEVESGSRSPFLTAETLVKEFLNL